MFLTNKNLDFEEFKMSVPWFFGESEKVELLKTEESLVLNNEFQDTFPKLTRLIQKARVLNVRINEQSYKLFSWTNKENWSCGWLSKIESDSISQITILDEHSLLLNSIGGIQECYNQPESNLLDNQNFFFIKSECLDGIGSYDKYYEDMCNEGKRKKIDYSSFISFVQEANGSLTLYDLRSKKVMLFSHDHCFDEVEFMDDQPKYTFHTFKKIKTFTDYVEELANQWLNEIES